jgi:hypothetical protein
VVCNHIQTRTMALPPTRIISIDVGVLNMAICTLLYTEHTRLPFKILSWELMSLRERHDTISVEDLVRKCLGEFAQRYPSLDKNDRVLIERQLHINSHSYALSMALYGFMYRMHPLRDLANRVMFRNASLKPLQSVGRKRKKEACMCTKDLLPELVEDAARWVDWLSTLNKLDDLSDAFLQAIYWVRESIDNTT